MLELIRQIDLHWKQKTTFHGISPLDSNGYFNFRNIIIKKKEAENMLREKLINIIARCNDKDTRKKWIIEMSESGIECPESACDSCLIAKECLEMFGYDTCVDDCKVSDDERCRICNFINGGVL